ncbi:MAG TPA: TlpA disulfide reductase family protein [Pyrinomonadaceae bacterium]|nr:TlpA disulfide reductase family protein [Pyrinomonadaceae bacterium]
MAVKKDVETKIRFWTPLRLVSTVIVLGLLAAFGVSSCNSNDPPVRVSNPNLPLLPAVVLDTELQAASGGPIKLSNYSGKVMLVNLWATWCGPCRMETPELVRLHKEYQDRVQFVGLSTEDPVASAQKVQEFIKQYEVDYQIGWATRDVALTLMQGQTSIPQSFIITRDGRIQKRLLGFHPQRTPPQLKEALESALGS